MQQLCCLLGFAAGELPGGTLNTLITWMFIPGLVTLRSKRGSLEVGNGWAKAVVFEVEKVVVEHRNSASYQ